MAGAPEGNQNARRALIWRNAVQRAITRIGPGLNEGLDKLADELVAAALGRESWALEHVANRLDGKATEHLQIDQEITVNVGERASFRDRIQDAVKRAALPPIQ